MCSIHLDDVTAAILRQNAHHTPAYWWREDRVMKPISVWGWFGGHDVQRPMGKFGQDAGVTPLLFFEGHPGIFNDHRESGPRFNVSSEGRIPIPRCLIIDCFYGPRYVSHPPFLERSANLWVHRLCASITASYTLVYLWIFIDYYSECEMADASTYLERSNRESTHIYGLLVTPRKRGVESAELTSI